MGYRFEELGDLLHTTFGELPVYVCLDTCHLWAAGYDITAWDSVIAAFDEHVGRDRLLAIHLNDAKIPRDSRRDRHANHGRGFIGYTGISHVAQRASSHDILTIQETPNDELWADEIAAI